MCLAPYQEFTLILTHPSSYLLAFRESHFTDEAVSGCYRDPESSQLIPLHSHFSIGKIPPSTK